MGAKVSRWLLVAALTSLGIVFSQARGGVPEVQACGAAGPYDFDTVELEDYVTQYNRAIELVTAGKAITSVYTVPGTTETIDVRYQGLVKGPRVGRTSTADTSNLIPPTIYKSIVWIEANWNQAAPAVPFGGVGPGLRSFDCGYGLGQITSGMSNATGVPTARQATIGTHFLFNIAEGVRILAEKWNSAPRFRPIAGTGDPTMLEDWYYAIWSYNGFAFSNHPLNPSRDPLRGGANGANSPIYHCFDPTAPSFQDVGGSTPKFGYGDYTYAERVYGCMKYPPRRAPVGSPANTPTAPFWPSVQLNMPDFTNAAVAAAFAPENYTTCEDVGFSGGCPKMDFPTTITLEQCVTGQPCDPGMCPVGQTCPPKATPHKDPTPAVNPALAAGFLGNPSIQVSGTRALEVTIAPDGTVSAGGTLTVSNAGTGIAPFRIRASESWLVARHPNDSTTRTLDAGIAIGAETDVVTQQKSIGPPARDRVAQKGYVSTLLVTVDGRAAPVGRSEATLTIDPLLGGTPFQMAVVVNKAPQLNATPTPTPTGQTPTPEFRAVVVNVVTDGPLY